MPKARNDRTRRRFKATLTWLVLAAVGVWWFALHRADDARPTSARAERADTTERAATAAHLTARAAPPTESDRETEPSPTGLPISGVVVDAAGGPIPGAHIEAREPGVVLDAWIVAGESRADGQFELRVPEGPATLRTGADGYSVDRRAVMSPDRSLRVQLSPAARITGQVVSALDDKPLFGIEVHATRAITLLAAPSEGVTVSDQKGRFVIDALAADTYRVIARSPEWFGQTAKDVTLRVGDSANNVRLVLHPAVVVRGRVLVEPKREPCSAGLAFLRSEAGQAYASSVAIGAAGAVEFTGVPPGPYRIEFRCQDGFATSELPIIRVGATDLDLVWTLSAGGRVAGRVVDRIGRGLARAVDANAALDEDASRLPFRAARSDEHGDFELTGLGAGRYRIGLTDAPGVHQELDIVPGAETAKVTLQVQHGASLRVQLSGADSAALDAFSVRAVRRAATPEAGAEQALAAQRAGPGLFVISDLPEGSYELYADDGRNPVATLSTSLLADQVLSLSWPIPVHDGKLEGRVMDTQGEPVGDAWVRVTNGVALSGLDGTHAVLTQLDGRFSLEHLDRSAAYDIEASRSPESSVLMRSVRPGQLAVLTLPAEPD